MAMDFIDPWSPDWWQHLVRTHEALQEGQQLQLLIDSAFIPNLHRSLRQAGASLSYLFDGNPGDPDTLRSVSPLLWTFDPAKAAVHKVLAAGSGAPMLSALVTPEPQEALARRLHAWCVVEVDGQWFNCRFPDTRRLPGILTALTPEQRGQMTGPATSWHWIGRDGRWVVWSLAAPAHAAVQEATLAPAQFSAILDDAMADEVLFKFMMQGEHSGLRHAVLHALVAKALPVAQAQGLPDGSCVAWCSHWVAQAVGLPDGQMGEAELQRAWQDWLQENAA